MVSLHEVKWQLLVIWFLEMLITTYSIYTFEQQDVGCYISKNTNFSVEQHA